MLRLLVLPLVVVALQPYASSIRALPAPLKSSLQERGFWQPGCPVGLSQLRILTVTHWGFDARPHTGQLIVNREVAPVLASVFGRLYELRFPIRHMRLSDMYGGVRPADDDVTASFHCRKAVPSPCTGGTASRSWSNHAYGYAIDLNPVENPYVGCGRVHHGPSARYVDRTPLRKGMVTPAVVRAFRSIGWGWGGDWTGPTKDYMHFSVNGR